MKLTSADFCDGAAIPRRFACDREDLSPALEWRDAPAEAKSFALPVDDPDAPRGVFRHWACYDSPAACARLAEGAAGAETSGASARP